MIHKLVPISATAFLIFCPVASAQAAKKELSVLKASYGDAVGRAVTPLRDKYLAELRRLKDSYTKTGDLESALIIDAEIKGESSGIGASVKGGSPESAEELKSYMMIFRWTPMSNLKEIYKFKGDDKIDIKDAKAEPRYKVTGRRTLTMFWTAKSEDNGIQCLLSEDGLALVEQSGARTVWTRSHL